MQAFAFICGTNDATRDLDLQVVVGISYGFLFLWRDISAIMCKEAPLSTNIHPVLRLNDRFGLVDVFASSFGE